MNILDRIESNFDHLSRKQQQIAQYLVENRNKAGFMSLKEMSAKIKVSEVTILNFCKSIGVDSFVQLKKDFQNVIKEELHVPNEIRDSLEELKSLEEAYENSINMHRENTEQIIKVNFLKNVEESAEIIRKARRIFICGQGISKIISEYLHVRLRLLDIDARILEIGDIINTSVELGGIAKDDCFILISFPVYSQNLVGLSRFLQKRDLSFVAMTDTKKSPIAEHASSVLLCNSKALVFQNSISAPMFLSEILLDTLSFKMKEQLMVSLDKLEETREALAEELLSQ